MPAARSARSTIKKFIRAPFRWLTGRGRPEDGWPRSRREFDAFWADDAVLEAYETETRAGRDRMVLDLFPGRPRRLLDVGCGAGRFLKAAMQKWPGEPSVELWGVDFSQAAIDRARTVLPAATLRCAPADALGLPDAHFDAVASLQTLEHVPEPEKALSEVVRVLAPGGTLMVSVPDAATDTASCHVNFWTLDEFRAFLRPHGTVQVVRGPENRGLIGTLRKPAPSGKA